MREHNKRTPTSKSEPLVDEPRDRLNSHENEESPTDLLNALLSKPHSLRERIKFAVSWGFLMGFVELNEATGLARARRLGAAGEDDDEPPFASAEEERAYCDLEFALELGVGQRYALEFLEEPLERSSIDEVIIAGSLASLSGLIATGRAPEGVLAEFLPIMELGAHEAYGSKQPLWFFRLLDQFDLGLEGDDARSLVDGILRRVCSCRGPVPQQFRRRDPLSLALAAELIRTTRIELPDEDGDAGVLVGVGDAGDLLRVSAYQPECPQPGRPMKPWRVAVEFAKCFGVTVVPERERDAKQRKRGR